MSHFRLDVAGGIAIAVLAAACTAPTGVLGPNAATPLSPSGSLPADASHASVGTRAEQPPFNLEAILRGDGFGLVKFRQVKDPARNIIDLDVWVRDLLPTTNYSLQRATDTTLDDVCTGTNWLTLGRGPVPEPIVTDERGTGRASLWRDLSFLPSGTPFDIHFRVVRQGTTDVALQSDCYRFVVRD
jgi:hypothetical protein